MLEILLIALYVIPVIIAANLAVGSKRSSALLALLTFGFVNISGLWRLCAYAVKRLSRDQSVAFDANKPVHRAAAFLFALGLLNLFSIYLIADLPGDESAVVSLGDALPQLLGMAALHLTAAFLGVGWLLRRRLPAVLRRLELRLPTPKQALISIAAGVGLWLLTTAAVSIWEGAVPPEIFEAQTETARRYSEAFSASAIAALLLAVAPAVSEEIFYRGALQPVFGVFLTSLFFTAMHTQYGLTPATLILFAVSLGFAWLRLRYHTGAAILSHAVFNFMPYLAGA